jgi:hypothetical protein
MTLLWTTCKHKLKHDCAIMGWALSIMPEVYKDPYERLIGKHWDVIEGVVRKLFKYPSTNKFPDLNGKSDDEMWIRFGKSSRHSETRVCHLKRLFS